MYWHKKYFSESFALYILSFFRNGFKWVFSVIFLLSPFGKSGNLVHFFAPTYSLGWDGIISLIAFIINELWKNKNRRFFLWKNFTPMWYCRPKVFGKRFTVTMLREKVTDTAQSNGLNFFLPNWHNKQQSQIQSDWCKILPDNAK